MIDYIDKRNSCPTR